MARQVVITGGAGYLGSILTEHLLRHGFKVRVLDNLMFGEQSLRHFCAERHFDFVLGDARDNRTLSCAIADADIIIPLAALVGAPMCDLDPEAARSTNYEAIKMIDEIRGLGQLVIYPTTNSGYGTKSGDAMCTEESALEPISLYGRTKVEAEQLLLDRPNAITLRLATVFGMSPRMRLDLLVNHFTYAAVKDGYLVVFEKQFRRNFVHIRDVADCFLHCIDNFDDMVGQPFNVGLDDANLTKEELACAIKQQVPNFYVHYAEIGTDPDKRDYIVSNEKLRQAGFLASRSLEEGITELIKGYRMMGRGHFSNV